MTVDGYPSDVPAQYRVRTEFTDFFFGTAKQGEPGTELIFNDRAADLGLAIYDVGRGVAVEDFDGDGFFDIVTGGPYDQVRSYRNMSGTAFEEVSATAGLSSSVQPHFISAADFDADGRMDLFLGSIYQPFRLYRNVGDFHLQDVTKRPACSTVPRTRRP